ncbi:MAG: hypothetical protein MI919_21440, partial [Holophagales bacterium]|nr:hypothetical protein [Holophagales bacterium]
MPLMVPLLGLFLGCLPVVGSNAAEGTPGNSGSGTAEGSPAKGPSTMKAPDWKRLQELVDDQQYEAAAAVAEEIEAATREAGDGDSWTRAVVRRTQLRTALHGYATAIRELREAMASEEPRRTPMSQAVLGLFYGRTLATYLDVYGWQVQQREKVVEGAGEPDLELWTAGQIRREIERAYGRVWSARSAWGERSIGELSEYLESSNYPAHIRGTLRDTVSYLWVELLADSSFWSAAQSNGLFRLDLDALLADAEPHTQPAESLEDPAVHPLSKVRGVLADLEAWHAEGGRSEAAFEARSTLVEVLAGSFTVDEDQARLRADLENRLEELGRQYPWWSMGMAQLAELQAARGDAPDALVEARRLALEGQRAHPRSPGGQRCRNLSARIEQPRYQVQSMQLDGPGRRSVEVRHANLERLHFRAYPIDFPGRIEGSTRRQPWPDHEQVQSLV